jgi:molybdenum cofactor cytidylyltransferase
MITGIILASGLSRRMAGQDKLLLPVAGMPMIEHVMRAAHHSQLDQIVLAYQNPAVAGLVGKYRISPVYNPDAEQGQSASVRTGILAAATYSEAYMFLTGDQPRLTSAAIDCLVKTWRDHPGRIIVPVYGERRGSPVVFPAAFRNRLLALEGDTGGRLILEESPEAVLNVAMPEADAGIDIDTPEDFEAVK